MNRVVMPLTMWRLVLAVLLAANLSVLAQSNGILRELYLNIPGTGIADLTNAAVFPNSPSQEEVITGGFDVPGNAESYGQRLRALLIPPATGNYTIWIASDDASHLYLSTDDTPSRKVLIACVDSWTNVREWTKEANQVSSPISLTAGRKYYIEVLMKEGGGGDHVEVRWQLPSGTMEDPIPNSRLEPFGLGPPVITTQPANISVTEGGTATFSIQLARMLGATFQWLRNGTNIPGATGPSYSFGPVTLADQSNTFRCFAVNPFGSTNSASATLRVNADTTRPTLVSVVNLGDPQLVSVLFSEPVELASATTLANYALNQGASITGATLGDDLRTVLLRTSPLGQGLTYTLTVNNVRDRATTPNVITTNAQRNFTLTYTPLDISLVQGRLESLGPSSRRSGLVISEIMYHPADRADGLNPEYVELFNSNPWPETFDGYRLSGEIDYTFPSNTVINGLGFLVVAASPADMQTIYRLNNARGPYTNALPNDSGMVRLRDRQGAVLVEAIYGSDFPYPAAADGAGHSLVLARPSYGERDPRAWTASDIVGGSPGAAEAVRANTYRNIHINELLAHTDPPALDAVELFNYGASSVNLSGCILTDDPATNKFVIPTGTLIGPRSFLAFDHNQLGFALSSGDETIYLINTNRTKVIDAVRFGAQENGRSCGRFPDGSPTLSPLTRPTLGTNNAPVLVSDVVINEIMYHPISEDNDDEYIELFNRGTNAVNLGKWRLRGGIGYTFPNSTVLPAGGYLVVAANVARFMTNYPGVPAAQVLGDFSGQLGNSGERITLDKPDVVIATNNLGALVTNTIHIIVDEVTYGTGGRWGKWSDGSGSSLELVDARADKRLAPSWADSDESSRGGWTVVEHTGLLDHGAMANADQLQLFLLGEGECLVDNVEVIPAGGGNIVPNSNFESGLAGWFCQGTHEDSYGETNGGYYSTRSLHLVAHGRGDTGANRIRTVLSTAPGANTTVTLRARVKWLKGHPELLLRLRGNWLEAVGRTLTTTRLGTPGAPNSRARANAGPAITEASHTPVLPGASQAVSVFARVHDPDGLASLVVKFRVDPSTNFAGISMTNNGAGFFSATLPGQAAGKIIAYYIEATDNGSPRATTRFPDDAPARECLIAFGETAPSGSFGTYRFWITQATQDRWVSRAHNNNKPFDATFVHGTSRVMYNLQTLYSGSPFVSPGYSGPLGGVCGYVLHFADDDPFLGAKDCVLDWPIRDGSQQAEQAAFWICRELGAPYLYRRFIHLFINGNRRGTIYEDVQQPNSDVIEEFFPDDTDGSLHKLEDWFEFDDSGDSMLGNVDATLGSFTTSGGVKKTSRYRWNWRPRATRESANNFTNLFALVDALNATQPEPYTAMVRSLVDIDAWMRVFATERIAGNWDSYGYNRGKNMFTYKPANGRWVLIPWDIDFVLGYGGDGATAGLFGGEPAASMLMNHPPFQRAYWRAYEDAVNGPLLSTKIQPMLTAKYNALISNGISAEGTGNLATFISQRRDYILSQLATVAASFSVTGATNFTTNRNLVTLSGTAPIGVEHFTINGVEYNATWASVTTWSLRVPLQSGQNQLRVQGWNNRGQPMTNSTAVYAINYTGPVESSIGNVVINEIMYNPLVPDATYVELHNASASNAYDLSRWRIDGIDFDIPEGTVIDPNAFLVFVKDPFAFARAYGQTIPVAGTFDGSLDNNGETLTLIKPGATPELDVVIDQVTYESVTPWPTAANGAGPSLQLIDARQDNNRVSNWGVGTSATLYTPRAANSVRATLPAFPKLWINELQPQNINRVADSAGDFDPWCELFNGGTNTISLSGYYLANNYTNMAQWVFPTNASIGPGQFLVVWLDGETAESSAQEWHANFRINAETGSVALLRYTNSRPNVLDYINYNVPSAGRSVGDYPDGNVSGRQLFSIVTPGATNNPTGAAVTVFINEWMADNIGTLADPADSDYEDWIELYNPTESPIDLSGYYLTDTLTNQTMWTFPTDSIVPAQGFLLVWADSENSQNRAGREPHTNFRLSSQGETIGLFAPGGGLIDTVTFGPQTNDVSQGRFADGQAPIFYMSPTPRTANLVPQANHSPVISAITDKTIGEGSLLTFTIVATDSDSGQTLTFSLDTNAPPGATVDSQSGVFSWVPTEAQGPGHYAFAVRVTDDGTPPLFAETPVIIDVFETNNTPVLGAIVNQFIDETATLTITNLAADPDTPATNISYTLDPVVPAGVLLDPVTGVLTWTPAEDQGPGTFFLTVRATDNGTPALSDSRTFTVFVLESNAPPVIVPIPTQTISLSAPFSLPIVASDPDLPANMLTYSLEPGAPSGADINSTNGLFTWASPQTASTNEIIVRVTDNGTPNFSVTHTLHLVVTEIINVSISKNSSLVTLTWQTVPGATYQVQMKANLSDPEWTTIEGLTTDGGTVTLDAAVGENAQRFYRIRKLD